MRLAAFVCGCLLASVGGALAGQLGGAFGFRVEDFHIGRPWEPSRCMKPSAPTLIVVSRGDYNDAVDRYNSFVDETNAYIGCLKAEAKGDLERLNEMIVNSANELIRAATSEVDHARKMLTLQKLH